MHDNQSTSWNHGFNFFQFMKNKAFWYIKRMLYEAMFGCSPTVRLYITPVLREMFDPVEDEQQFKKNLYVLFISDIE